MISVFNSNIFILILIFLQIISPYIYSLIPLPAIVWLCLSEILFILVPAFLYMSAANKNPIRAFSLKPLSLNSALLLILFALFIQPLMGVLAAVSSLLFPTNVSDFINALNTLPFPAALFISAVSPAICEEFAFRGVFMSDYENKSLKYAAFVNGLMFAIIHLNGEQFLYAFAMGVLLSYILKITESIFSTILVHFTFNGSQLILSKVTQNISDTALEGISVFYLILFLFSIPMLYFIVKKLIKVNNKEEFIKNSLCEKLIFDKEIVNWAALAIIIIYFIQVIVPLFPK